MWLLGAVLCWMFLADCVVCLEESQPNNLCNDVSIENLVLSEIRAWWQEMSPQKPLNKCKTPKEWIIDSPLLNVFSNQVPMSSFPCGPGESYFQIYNVHLPSVISSFDKSANL